MTAITDEEIRNFYLRGWERGATNRAKDHNVKHCDPAYSRAYDTGYENGKLARQDAIETAEEFYVTDFA